MSGRRLRNAHTINTWISAKPQPPSPITARFRRIGPAGEIVETAFMCDGRMLRVVGLPNGASHPWSASREMDCTIAWERRGRTP